MAWREARMLRDFVESVRRRGVADENWIQWASARREEMDPLSEHSWKSISDGSKTVINRRSQSNDLTTRIRGSKVTSGICPPAYTLPVHVLQSPDLTA